MLNSVISVNPNIRNLLKIQNSNRWLVLSFHPQSALSSIPMHRCCFKLHFFIRTQGPLIKIL